MRPTRVTVVLTLLAGLAGCGRQTIGGPGQPVAGADAGPPSTLRQKLQIVPTRNQLDLLIVVDDSANAAAQQKLVSQLPGLLQQLEALPDGLPDLHIGVISTDMGGGPQPPPGCTATGKAGQLQSAPRGNCADTTLAAGATFISAAGGLRNFTAPLEQVVQCIVPLGSDGCGFRQPLAAIVRALGADGARPPLANRDFLRPTAALGILILSTHDDCSPSPGNTDFFTRDPGASGLSDPLGPLDSYRCNRYGHLCDTVGGGRLIAMPPLVPPAGVTGTPPSVELTHCVADDLPGGPLTPVSDVVALINGLKDDPGYKISVSAIAGPPVPYGVQWSPAGAANPQNPGELWPSVMLSCGAPGDAALNPATMDLSSDGTEAEPALRIAQFAQSFAHGLSGSICRPSYATVTTEVAQGLGTVTRGLKCIGTAVPLNALQQPDCTVEATYLNPMNAPLQVPIPFCDADAQAPCWRAETDATLCPGAGYAVEIIPDVSLQNAAGLVYDVSCATCGSQSAFGCH
ncbi:MAG: hypothetical protein ABUS79_12855 [Pseudomonadota bacterium]